MTPERHPHHNPDTVMDNSILVEIVDHGGPLTPEELTRPRYGRPARPPQDQASTFCDSVLVEFTDPGQPPDSGDSAPPRRGGPLSPPDEPRGPGEAPNPA